MFILPLRQFFPDVMRQFVNYRQVFVHSLRLLGSRASNAARPTINVPGTTSERLVVKKYPREISKPRHNERLILVK